MESVQHLVVGLFAALGGAMALGTLAALVRYHRTGTLPGQPESAPVVPRRRLAALWLRVAVGAVVAVAGVASLARAGLL